MKQMPCDDDQLSSIRALARRLAPTMISVRRQIHARPELAFEERETAALVSERLTQLDIPHTCGVAGTGIVATITGVDCGGVLGLRADMDALPVLEASSTSYRSRIDGLMHACGHDAHVAMLLGAAEILIQHRQHIHGDVVLIFQPAEEIGAGARAMAETGAIPRLDALVAMHVGLGHHKTGEVGIAAGPLLAGAEFFEASFMGKGGHGAQPHLAVNPIYPCARWVLATAELVAVEAPPKQPCIATTTSVQSGTNANVIPDRAVSLGSIRSFDQGLLKRLAERLAEQARHCAASSRATAEFTITRSFPPTHNSSELARLATPILSALLGAESVVKALPTMGSEDIAWLAEAPLLYLFLGSHRDAQAPSNHHPAFDIDEDCLAIGSAVQAALAAGLLAGIASDKQRAEGR